MLGTLGTFGALSFAHAGKESVMRRPIPSSGEMIPIIGLGTNRFGVGDSADARAPLRDALNAFYDWGGGLVDTAPMYGSSEAVLGDLIADLDIADRIFMATKTDRDHADATIAQARVSEERLNDDSIDLLQIHNLRGWQHTIPLLNEWKQEGRIRYTGITTSRGSQYAELEQILSTHEFDFVQINYSLEQREAAERLMPLAADRGSAVIINRAFGGGRIFRELSGAELPEWAKEIGCESWAQFLLKYALSHPATTVVIPGMTKARHVNDNFRAATSRMPTAAERKRQEAFFDAL